MNEIRFMFERLKPIWVDPLCCPTLGLCSQVYPHKLELPEKFDEDNTLAYFATASVNMEKCCFYRNDTG